MKKKILFEVCCGCTEDAVQAERGGADRIELNSALFLGGLTPSIGTLEAVKAQVKLPVMCMVRPREGGFCYTDFDYDAICRDALALIRAGADGVVFGFLKPDGTVDEARCADFLGRIRAEKPEIETVFHRAIDVVPDVFAALDTLIALNVTRVLTSGQRASAPAGAETIRRMRAHAAGRIDILPGGRHQRRERPRLHRGDGRKQRARLGAVAAARHERPRQPGDLLRRQDRRQGRAGGRIQGDGQRAGRRGRPGDRGINA